MTNNVIEMSQEVNAIENLLLLKLAVVRQRSRIQLLTSIKICNRIELHVSRQVLINFNQNFNEMSDFWKIVEVNTGICLPTYLKNTLQCSGYNDASSIKSITPDDIDSLEKFAREDMQDYISEKDNKEDYYHVFHDKIDKFKIVKGDRVKLMDVVEFVKSKLASKAGINFFYRSERTKEPKKESANTLKSQELVQEEQQEQQSVVSEDQSMINENEKQSLKDRLLEWMEVYAKSLYLKVS